MIGHRERKLEQQFGNLDSVIPTLVNTHGQHETAKRLGVSQSFVSTWLKRNRYRPKIIYFKEGE